MTDMSVARIGETRAKPGFEDALRAKLESLVTQIAALPGCISCELFVSEDEPSRMLMIERWESKAAHKGAVMNIPPEEIAEFMKMLDGRPSGAYFSEVARKP
jgi:quinol monooxygenase YgiN